MGLQALAAYAETVVSDNTNLDVEFSTNSSDTFSHTITADNAIITKKNSVSCSHLDKHSLKYTK